MCLSYLFLNTKVKQHIHIQKTPSPGSFPEGPEGESERSPGRVKKQYDEQGDEGLLFKPHIIYIYMAASVLTSLVNRPAKSETDAGGKIEQIGGRP